MIKSSKPRKQRKYRYEAPLHIKRKFLNVHLSKELRAQYKRRSLLIRKNDKVKILRGEFKGKETKVIDVDIKKGKVYLEDVKRKNAKGIEVNIPISPSNLLLIEPVLDDPKRREKLVEVKK